jgi:hypothetical protein
VHVEQGSAPGGNLRVGESAALDSRDFDTDGIGDRGDIGKHQFLLGNMILIANYQYSYFDTTVLSYRDLYLIDRA